MIAARAAFNTAHTMIPLNPGCGKNAVELFLAPSVKIMPYAMFENAGITVRPGKIASKTRLIINTALPRAVTGAGRAGPAGCISVAKNGVFIKSVARGISSRKKPARPTAFNTSFQNHS